MTDVTIVVPTRERPEFLRATLHSILASAAEARRGGTTTRILVVDDASPTHSTERLAAELGVDYHRIAVHDGRNNPATAIATGVGLVESPFYSLFGDDDIMLPRFIGAHVAALAAGHDVCSTSFIQTDADLTPVREVLLPEATLGDLLAGKVTINDGAMTRTELTRDLEWDRSLDQVILYPIWLELLFRGARFARLTEPSFLYRRHDGNVSDQLGAEDAAQRERVRQAFRERVIARDGAVPEPSAPPGPPAAASRPAGVNPRPSVPSWRRLVRRLRSSLRGPRSAG